MNPVFQHRFRHLVGAWPPPPPEGRPPGPLRRLAGGLLAVLLFLSSLAAVALPVVLAFLMARRGLFGADVGVIERIVLVGSAAVVLATLLMLLRARRARPGRDPDHE